MSVTWWLARLLLGRRLARTTGRITVPELPARVTIRRDAHGIPVIEADSESEAFFGLGFCHGQDRPFQLEALLRVVRGTLCELFGPDPLPVDRLCRRIGFYRSAERHLAVLTPEVRTLVESYAAGVRAGQTLGLPRRPHEFVLLGAKPTPWTAVDSLALVKLIAFTLSSNWGSELARLQIWREDGAEAVRALDPTYPAWLPVTLPLGAVAGEPFDRLGEELTLLRSLVGSGGGSNNWVLAPSRTATGRPILANDPHLTATLPAHWYLASLRYPEGAVAGAGFLGAPTILSGHNGHAAWGVTAGLIDNTDLFLEQLGPDGRTYRQGDTFHPCTVREETIAIRGKAAVREVVLETPRGPILTGTLEGVRDTVSLRALWLDPRPLRGLLLVHRAKSFAEFRDILAEWPGAPQNMVYADTTGTIGWQLVGQSPRRKFGHGAMPLPAWDERVGWEEDLVPRAQLPHGENPHEGFLATANACPVPEGQGPLLSVDWIDGYRLLSIQTALAGRQDWSIVETQRLQVDQRTPVWAEIRTILLSIPASTPARVKALELLRAWDGVLGIDAAAGSIYEVWLAELAARVAKAKAPKTWETALGKSLVTLLGFNFFCFRRSGHLVRLLREQPPGWFAHGWPTEIANALDAALRTLEPHGGRGWGQVRPLVLRHPLGRNRLLAPLFDLGPFPHGGDTDTINQATTLPLAPLDPAPNIASLRTVIDVGAWSNSRFALPGGQSGNPFSPHYADLLPFWKRGDGVPIPWSPDEIAACRSVLTLEPGT